MKNGLVTVLITVWKRDYLEQQLKSLVNQSMPPAAIWIIHNENHITIRPVVDNLLPVFPAIYVIHSDFNLKYFGRFALCTQASTDFIQIIDDDVIPGSDWLKICVEKCSAYNAVISCSGRLVPPGNFRPEAWKHGEQINVCVGDNYNEDERNYVPEDTWVDYGCNSYFFKREWIRYFWELWPITFLSGEDIHLSASLSVQQSIPTLVPAQLCEKTSGNLKKYYSQDQFSSWKQPGFIDIRENIFKYLIKEKNWLPIQWK